MTVRWGVLGAGMISDAAMLPAIGAAAGAELYAIAARDPLRAKAFAERHGVFVAHASYVDLLADPSVDAVYVALANDAHKPWTLAALAAGKHVLCEKPLALSVAEVDEMTAAAEAAGRLLVEASWYRWHPRTRAVESLLRAGEIGAVTAVSGGFSFGGVATGNYRLDPALGGGALYDIGCYVASAALWAFGTPPREVAAKTEEGPTGVDLTASFTVSFDGGTADLWVSIADEQRQWLTITGEHGEVELRPAPYTAWHGDETEIVLTTPDGVDADPVPATDAYRLMVEQTSAVIEGRPGWVVPLADSRATATVLDAAFASASTGAPVAV